MDQRSGFVRNAWHQKSWTNPRVNGGHHKNIWNLPFATIYAMGESSELVMVERPWIWGLIEFDCSTSGIPIRRDADSVSEGCGSKLKIFKIRDDGHGQHSSMVTGRRPLWRENKFPFILSESGNLLIIISPLFDQGTKSWLGQFVGPSRGVVRLDQNYFAEEWLNYQWRGCLFPFKHFLEHFKKFQERDLPVILIHEVIPNKIWIFSLESSGH